MQNHALKDLTKCRQGQPEDPIWTKTFQNEVTTIFALIPLVPLDPSCSTVSTYWKLEFHSASYSEESVEIMA